MEPSQYVRLLRRRWVWLLFCASLGASLAYATTLFEEEPVGPLVQHWEGKEVLIVPPEIEGNTVDLKAISIFATAGEVPKAVAADLEMSVEDLTPTLRTVADRSVRTLTVSAVATSLEESRLVAESISIALLEGLALEAEAEFQVALVEANGEVEAALVAATAVEAELASFEAGLPPAEERTSTQTAQLRGLQLRSEAAIGRITAAEEAVRQLETDGPAQTPLERFETIPPLRISQREFDTRIAQGRQGLNNFFVGEVDLSDTSRPTVAERLESPAARAALGALAGLLVGIIIALVHIRLDPRLRSKDSVEDAFRLPVLTEIPEMPRRDRKRLVLHSRDRPTSVIAEAYRYLRSVLLFARAGADAEAAVVNDLEPGAPERDVRVLMVTSSGEGEGKTTTSVNLAVLMAEAGYKTVLFNCDFRLPTAHKMLGLEYEPGVVQRTSTDGLVFLADVERFDGETPGQVSERQRRAIREARQEADVVILDTAPVLATNDAIELLVDTDLVVMVAKENKTTKDSAQEARDLLIDRMGVVVAGVVITNAGAGMGSGYYEKYRYGSYFGSENATMWQVFTSKFGRKKNLHLKQSEPARSVQLDADAETTRFDLQDEEPQGHESGTATADTGETEPPLLEAQPQPPTFDYFDEVEPQPQPQQLQPNPFSNQVVADSGDEETLVDSAQAQLFQPASPEPSPATPLPGSNGQHGVNGDGATDTPDKVVVDPVIPVVSEFDPIFERPTTVQPVAPSIEEEQVDLDELLRSVPASHAPRHATGEEEIDLTFEDAGHGRRARRAANPDVD